MDLKRWVNTAYKVVTYILIYLYLEVTLYPLLIAKASLYVRLYPISGFAFNS